MTERVNFGCADVIVISILWAYEVLNYWLISLSRYTSQVLFTGEELRSAYFKSNETWIFFTTCFAIVIVAFLMDAYGHKYAVSLTGLCLCFSTPIIAVFACITKIAPAAILMFWTVSIIFVVSPATYCLVFNQNLNPVRRQARFVVSFFECIENFLGKYLIFLCIPESAESSERETYTVIVIWVIITPLLVSLTTCVERMKKHVKGDFTNEKGIKRLLYGIRSDMKTQPQKREGRTVTQVIFFILLLLPAFSLTTIDVALRNISSDDDTHTQNPKLKHILYSVQVLVIPLTELVLSLTPMIKETASEMIVLGLAHVLNTAVLTLLIFRMSQIPGDRREFRVKREVVEQQRAFENIILSSPGPGTASFMIITSVPVKMKTVPPALFKGGADTYELAADRLFSGKYHLPINKASQTIDFTCTLNIPKIQKAPTLQKYITLFEKKKYIYFISGDKTHIEFTEVLGIENVRPKEAPQLIFVNSFIEKMIDGIPVISDHEYRVNSTENGFDERYPLPKAGTYDVLEVPVGKVEVTYSYMGSNEHLIKKLGDGSTTFTTEPNAIYLSFLLRDKESMGVIVIKTLTTPPVTTTTGRIPLPKLIPKEPDAIQKSSYALLGVALGIASVGYVHFFWMESPLRLRAALYALFRVSDNLVGWMTKRFIGDTLARPVAIALLSLQVFTTVWHLGLSWVFQKKIQPD